MHRFTQVFNQGGGEIQPTLFIQSLGPKICQDPPRPPQDPPKTVPRPPQDPPKPSQDGPRWSQDGPRWPQDGPKMAQDGPRWTQDGPKMDPRWTQDGPKNWAIWITSRPGGMRGCDWINEWLHGWGQYSMLQTHMMMLGQTNFVGSGAW